MKLSDAHFGVMVWDSNEHKLKSHNLFDLARNKHFVAEYVAHPERHPQGDWALFCFGDVWSRAQYEYQVGGLFGDYSQKIDVWSMYVEPNRQALYDIIHSISKSSALAYLREERKARKATKLYLPNQHK